jgi:hypothetical protein
MNMSTKFKLALKLGTLALMLFVAVAPLLSAPAHAQEDDNSILEGLSTVNEKAQLGNAGLKETIGSIINIALGFLGIIAVVIVLIGGFKYMIAGGNEQNLDKAKKWIYSGIIGLAIILCAYAITYFVISNLLRETGSDQPSD